MFGTITAISDVKDESKKRQEIAHHADEQIARIHAARDNALAAMREKHEAQMKAMSSLQAKHLAELDDINVAVKKAIADRNFALVTELSLQRAEIIKRQTAEQLELYAQQ